MPENDDQRERRATDLAFEQGKRQAEVDGRLDSHEERLRAINGSIEKHARNVADLRKSMDGLGDKVDGIASTLTTRTAIEVDRAEQVKKLNESQLNSRTFLMGVAGVMVMLLGVIVSLLIAVHAI